MAKPVGYIGTVFWILRMPSEELEGPFPRLPTELGADDQVLTMAVGNWTKSLGWTSEQKKLRAERDRKGTD
jgi:hypothetical protein